MINPFLRFCNRCTLLFFQVLLFITMIICATICVLFWKLSEGPVDVTFAAGKVKSALVSKEHQQDFHFDSIVAEWPEFNGPISIGMSGVKLSENDKPVVTIPQLGIRLAKTPLFYGSVRPEAIIVRDPTIKLIRNKNGGIRLFAEEAVPEEDKPMPETRLQEIGEALFKGGRMPKMEQARALSKLERVSLENAHIVIIDEEFGTGWNIPEMDFELLRAENQFTLEAKYQEGKDVTTNLSFLALRDEDNQSVRIFSELDGVNISTLGRLFLPVERQKGLQFIVRGKAEGHLDKDWNLLKLDADMTSDQGQFSLAGYYQSPLKFSNLEAYLSYDKSTDKIILHDTHIDINNRTINLSGEKIASEKTDLFGLHMAIPQMTMDELHSLWPETQRESIAADWLVNRLGKATITDLKAFIPINIQTPENTDTTVIDASFRYENLTADYQAPLYPVTQGKGVVALKNDVLTIDVESGKLGKLDIQKAQIQITKLTHPTDSGVATINADLKGDVAEVFRYIALDPINLSNEIGINPDKVKGATTLNAKVSFPALKDLPKDDVVVVVDADLNDVLLPQLVNGMDLTGGPYKVNVKEGKVLVSGKGALHNQPVDLTYTQYIDPANAPFSSQAKVSVLANQGLREKFGVNLDQFISGNVPVTVEYTQGTNNDETVILNGDLTPVEVRFSPLKYKKRVGQRGDMTCHVFIQNGEVRQIKDLKINIDKGGSAVGNIAFGMVGKENDVKTGKFSNVTLGGANNFMLDFTQTAPNVFDVNITGKQFDARPFLGNGGEDIDANTGESSVKASVKVNQMKTGDRPENLLTSPVLSLQTNSAGDLTYLDLLGNFPNGQITVSLKPDETGRSRLAIKSDNAGGALKALDLYDNVIGGQLEIRGTQIKGGGVNDIKGRGIIRNFSVVRAPVLAKLINLFSLSGLTELLQNKGIEFTNLRTEFEWKDTKNGRVIALQNGKTTGASIGLTFGGNINQDKGSVDISGTFVPMSEINSIFNKIPVIGSLLTGGKNGGVIAATYAMTGKSSDPNVFVNPLSVLTPGFLRSILFENNKNVFEGTDEDVPDSAAEPKKKSYNN